ncbi:MAG: phage holin family protein [Burkholderiales bacterium]
MTTATGTPGSAPGPFASLKALGRTALDIVHTRLALLVTEIAEEQGRLAELLVYAALTLIAMVVAVVMLAVLVMATLWDTPYRLVAAGTVAAVFAALGVASAVALVRKTRAKPRLFNASLDELGTDLERLQ